jgi:quercetin dioxygenase-like cupin family protein
MKVISYHESEPEKELEGVLRRDIISDDDGAPNFAMQLFEVDTGSSTASHSHPWEHEIFILNGKGVIAGEQGSMPITKGSVVFIAPNEPHCIVNTGNEHLEFICVIPLPKQKK